LIFNAIINSGLIFLLKLRRNKEQLEGLYAIIGKIKMRYIGAKTELLSEIADFMKHQGLFNKKNYTFCDAFSGTGTVSDYFKNNFRICANDVQYYSFVLTQAKLNTPDLQFRKLGFDPFEYFNTTEEENEGFVFNEYSYGGSANRMYFSSENGKRIDFIRKKIEEWCDEKKIDKYEYYYLIASLLESVSKVANIAGVYGSFLKTWDPRAIKRMSFIHVELISRESSNNEEREVRNEPIEKLITEISGDILYLDPPYTKNQYSVQYHLLETIARYDQPAVSGKGGLRNTSETSSAFSRTGEVECIFDYIIAKANFRYIILSYSSDGIMSKKFIETTLKRYGREDTYCLKKIAYKKYRNHQTLSNNEHCEYLFFIEKKEYSKAKYSSPLNYQGGKYDLIDFIKDNLPDEKPEKFIDVFGGGYNVGVNVDAEQNIYNDYNHIVAKLIEDFKNSDTAKLIRYINRTVKRYRLSPGAKNEYLALREKYNSLPLERRESRMLYVLIMYGFNQQIRFNSLYDCNNPVGPAGFNDVMLSKLVSFCRKIQEQNLVITHGDFDSIRPYITDGSFLYCDPPYLITLGSYNDGKRGFNGWSKEDECRLYDFLDEADDKNIRFMMSNVFEHNGKQNKMLKDWVEKNGYNVISFNGKSRKGRKEIIITNYKKVIRR
jgi:DNA adenine methylase